MTSKNFMDLITTYKSKGHNLLNIKLMDGHIYTIITEEFYYWRTSTFYVSFTPKRVRMGESKYELLPQDLKFIFPAGNFNIAATKEQLIARNPRDLSAKNIFVEVIKLTQRSKEPVYDKMTPTNMSPQENFIIIDCVYENVTAQKTDQYLYLNATAELKDVAFNLDAIVSIQPALPEIKDAIIKDNDILEAINFVERGRVC